MKYCNYISNVKDYIRWKAGVCFFQLNALSSYSILCFQPLFVTSHVDFRISKVEKKKKIFFTLIEDRNTTHAYRRCATTLELLYYSFLFFQYFTNHFHFEVVSVTTSTLSMFGYVQKSTGIRLEWLGQRLRSLM